MSVTITTRGRPRRTIDTSTYAGRFAAWLSNARDKTGLTRQQAAAAIGVPLSRLADWESARSQPPLQMLPRIGEALGLKDWRRGLPKK